MATQNFRYTFAKSIDVREAESTLLLALISIEALHGSTDVRLLIRYEFDAKRRACEIKADSKVGHDLNRLYVGFLTREFGARSFVVERIENPSNASQQEMSA